MFIYKTNIIIYSIEAIMIYTLLGCTDQTNLDSKMSNSVYEPPSLYRIPQVRSDSFFDWTEDQGTWDFSQESFDYAQYTGGSNGGSTGGSTGGNSGGSTGGSNWECIPLMCNQNCPDGYVQDEYGCFTCECDEFMGIPCFVDEDCFSFETCLDGYCVESGSMEFLDCTSNVDCPPFLLCMDGVCR